jgi:hypothetical protein
MPALVLRNCGIAPALAMTQQDSADTNPIDHPRLTSFTDWSINMGATVTTGKLVAAFKNLEGKTFYVLYEETYEKNVYPRTPLWSARAMGELEAVMRIIFLSASSCEGGMLQGAGGRYITPEGYISGWLKELANPVELADCHFDLSISDGWSAVIDRKEFSEIKPRLKAVGASDLATLLEHGLTISTSLYNDAEALSAIFDGFHLGVWRIFKNHSTPVHGVRNSALGYSPTKAKAYSLENPQFQKVSNATDSILCLHTDGYWRCAGEAYSYVARFVTELWNCELQTPGSYRKRIKTYRDAIENAPLLPSQGMKIVIDTSVAVQDWQQNTIRRLAKELGATTVGTELHIDVPNDPSQLYGVTRLPSACTKWVFSNMAPTEQMSLLAS